MTRHIQLPIATSDDGRACGDCTYANVDDSGTDACGLFGTTTKWTRGGLPRRHPDCIAAEVSRMAPDTLDVIEEAQAALDDFARWRKESA